MKETAMTRFLDAGDVGRLVRHVGVGQAIAEMASYIQQDLSRWDAFEKSARLASHSPEGVIELMPVTDGVQYTFKYVNGHPRNARHAMPTVMAFGVLAEVESGFPLLLADMTLGTALRTAATSALAAKLMARSGAATMALIGNGAQAEFQALAFHGMLGVHTIHAYDVDPAATTKLVRNLAGVPGLAILPAASARDAVRGADIITTATADKTRATILHPDMVRPGVHLNAVGGDCPGKTELHPDILRHARIVVEYAPQTRTEGEIQQLPADTPVTELWQLVAGQVRGRTNPDEITLFDSVGFALEDYSALRWLHAKAHALHIGRYVELVANAPDPRDLYGWVMAEEGETPAAAAGLSAAGLGQAMAA